MRKHNQQDQLPLFESLPNLTPSAKPPQPPAPSTDVQPSHSHSSTDPVADEIRALMAEYSLTEGVSCQRCGCPLLRRLAEYTACVRCYPARGYHLYSHLIDRYYRRSRQAW